MFVQSLLVFIFVSTTCRGTIQSFLTGDGGDIVCASNANECYVDCYAISTSFDCKEVAIDCPSTPNCTKCIINCDGDASCQEAVVNSHYCQDVEINLLSGSMSGKYLNVYSPGNYGNLEINGLENTGSGTVEIDVFSTPYANTQSGKIKINCYDGDWGTLTINATQAEYLEFNCFNDADCSWSKLYCPLSAYARSDGEKSCKLDCSSVNYAAGTVACEYIKVYADEGTPKDALILCNNSNSAACTGLDVYCDESGGFSTTCEYAYSDSNWACSSGSSECVAYSPTLAPTDETVTVPSGYPTVSAPSDNPTAYPTSIPSSDPTTGEPTSVPSSEPSTSPTGMHDYVSTTNTKTTSITTMITTKSMETTLTSNTTETDNDNTVTTTIDTTGSSISTGGVVTTNTESTSNTNTIHESSSTYSDSGSTISTTTDLNDNTDGGLSSDTNSDLEVESLNQAYEYAFYGFGGAVVLLALLGYIDAKFLRKNELYTFSSVLAFGTYSLDFFSGEWNFVRCLQLIL